MLVLDSSELFWQIAVVSALTVPDHTKEDNLARITVRTAMLVALILHPTTIIVMTSMVLLLFLLCSGGPTSLTGPLPSLTCLES